jgi:hypothetical protein
VDHAPRASLRMRRYRSVARKSSGLPSPPALAPELMLNANSASSRSDGWPPGCTSVGCGHSALVGGKAAAGPPARTTCNRMRCDVASALWAQCHDGGSPSHLHIHAVYGSPQTQGQSTRRPKTTASPPPPARCRHCPSHQPPSHPALVIGRMGGSSWMFSASKRSSTPSCPVSAKRCSSRSVSRLARRVCCRHTTTRRLSQGGMGLRVREVGRGGAHL